jgi:hypothetical protein
MTDPRDPTAHAEPAGGAGPLLAELLRRDQETLLEEWMAEQLAAVGGSGGPGDVRPRG